MQQRAKLIVWRDIPVDVEADVFRHVVQHWGNEVLIVHRDKAPGERAAMDWGTDALPHLDLSAVADPDAEARRILTANQDAIHLFNGFRGKIRAYLDWACGMPGVRIGLYAERPNEYGRGLKGRAAALLIRLIYRRAARSYADRMGVFLTMGQRGVDEYVRLGFPRQKMFPYMYGSYTDVAERRDPGEPDGRPVRLLYVGRLSQQFKGVDVLMRAAALLAPTVDGHAWELHFVGGYGDHVDEVRALADREPHIHYLGPWPAAEVVDRMQDYDLVVVPSKYDGWNVVPNHAINARVGAVVSDHATSDELVRFSGAGLVVPAGDPVALAAALSSCIADPASLVAFRALAADYEPSIRPDAIGGYLMDVLDHAFAEHKGVRPVPPWFRGPGSHGRDA